MKKTGYGVLGLGIGLAHAEAVLESENAILTAVCDIDERRLAEFATAHPQVRCYRSAEELFADPEVEIVSICLPSGLHAEYAVRAMEAGKHVLVEKPVDVSLAAAERMIAARQRTGKKCGVVLQNRFNLNMEPIREAVRTGRLGRLLLGTFAVKWYREQKYYDRGGWRGTWANDGGGSLINQASHTVDLMLLLMGDVTSVTTRMAAQNHRIETEDTTITALTFRNGALGTFVSTTCAYPGISTEICIYGSDGSVEADADRLTVWKMRNPAGGMDEEAEEERMLAAYGGGNRRAAGAHPGTLYGHRHVVEDMILAVREGRDPEVSIEDGMRSLSVILAMYESAKTGKTVYL